MELKIYSLKIGIIKRRSSGYALIYMNGSKVCILLVASQLLGACASHSSKAIAKLDSGSPEFSSATCQNARQNAWLYDEAQINKLWAGPSVAATQDLDAKPTARSKRLALIRPPWNFQ